MTGDVNPVVAGLVKIQTGLSQVSAPSYLKQAEEIFAKGNVATEGLSHPEAFIRARALALWQEQRTDAAGHISEMIEGATALDELDLIGQTRLTPPRGVCWSTFCSRSGFRPPPCWGTPNCSSRTFSQPLARQPGRSRWLEVRPTPSCVNMCATCCWISSRPTRTSTTCRWRPRWS